VTDRIWQFPAPTVLVPDGTYGDITVSGGGLIWTVTAGGITDAEVLARCAMGI
jgi:hypothetical protein